MAVALLRRHLAVHRKHGDSLGSLPTPCLQRRQLSEDFPVELDASAGEEVEDDF